MVKRVYFLEKYKISGPNNNIKYVAYDIEKDSAAKQRYEEMGGRGIPLIIIGDNIMPGFSQETFEHYMNKPVKKRFRSE